MTDGMRLYYTGASPANLRKAREHAPSHSHGAGWTPQKMTPHDVPYFVDNGAFTESFDPDAYHEALDRALTEMPASPDFFVLPDVYGDAEATVERHLEWLYHRKLPVGSGQVRRYWVLQPGMEIAEQLDALVGCQGVFVGGPKRWKRAYGETIVEAAADRGLRTHVGNPAGADGLLWAYRTGFDSVDTTTVFQNQYWHYLDRLERETGEPSTPTDTEQATLATDGGQDVDRGIERETLEDALATWGYEAQVDKAEEELAELLVALKGDSDAAVLEELADVRIMVEQLTMLFGEDAVEAGIAEKMQRLERRIARARDEPEVGADA